MTAAPVETTLAGQAVKGVLANAKVTVYKFDEAGEPVVLDPETELKDELLARGIDVASLQNKAQLVNTALRL